MTIKPEQLQAQLEQDLKPLFWVNGDEPLLLQECADQIRAYCRDNDFQEREIFSVDKRFNWELFSATTGNLSLFAQKKLIELRLDSPKLEDPGKQALQNYVASVNPDYLILITSSRIEPATLKTKWFKSLIPSTGIVQVWPLSVDELPRWLNKRLQREGINASPEALQLLVDRVEGNLLIAVQEIEKLKLLSDPDSKQKFDLDAETVSYMVADSSRYNAFNLIDAALAGNGKRALKIINGLHNEGAEPLMIIGAVSAELRRLLPMSKKVEAGQSIRSVLQSSRVNFKREQAVTSALQRVRPALIYSLLDQSRVVDYAVKGLSTNNPWIEIENLFLRLSAVVTATSRRTVWKH
ncbi:MAG: DNA polymerase III subunit delta [Gammaproteobacteria bacterium]|nr:DNA polymerase III subunit delta [Gammaproteobacteria bacterium]